MNIASLRLHPKQFETKTRDLKESQVRAQRSKRSQQSFIPLHLSFSASQLIRLSLTANLQAITENASALSDWQLSLNSAIEDLQPVLSIIRNALAKSQADMVSPNQSQGGVASLKEEEYTTLRDFFKKYPQRISGFRNDSTWALFPTASIGASALYTYSEVDLTSLNSALQQNNDLYSDQLNRVQLLLQMISQSYSSILDININFSEVAHATAKSLLSQFS